MALITSHILNSVSGMSAIGIRTQLFRIDENDTRYQIFEVQTDDEGRISQTVSSDYLNEEWLNQSAVDDFPSFLYVSNVQILLLTSFIDFRLTLFLLILSSSTALTFNYKTLSSW